MSADLRTITDFEDLIAYLGTELDWPVEDYNLEELTFEYDADELGLKDDEAEKLKDGTIRQLRPLPGGQPFGIFFVEFGQAKLSPQTRSGSCLLVSVGRQSKSVRKLCQPCDDL